MNEKNLTIRKSTGVTVSIGLLIVLCGLIFFVATAYAQVQDNTQDITTRTESLQEIRQRLRTVESTVSTNQNKIGNNHDVLIYLKRNLE